MHRAEILDRIAAFEPVDDNWRALDDLLGRLWETGLTPGSLPVLFGIFERYPDEDGGGVLWGIVHGVEALDIPYEEPLHASVARQPSLMGRIMLERLERANAV